MAIASREATTKKKSMDKPDEVRKFDKGKVEIVQVNAMTFGRATLEPGWKWSECVKPLVKTESCEASHLQYQVSGHLHVVMDDETEYEFGPGDVCFIPSGHDAWVVGDEPVVFVDISGMANYAKPS